MKRTSTRFKSKEPPPEQKIVLSKPLRDLIFQQENPSDVLCLYIFYYHTALWQDTDQPKATDEYCMKGCKLGQRRFFRTKKTLVDLGLIEQIRTVSKTGSVTGYYIKVNHIWKEPSNVITGQSINNKRLPKRLQSIKNPVSGNQETNALKTNIINAEKGLESNNNISSPKKVTKEQFDFFWDIYPVSDYKGSKGKAKTVWNKLCALPDDNPDKPTFIELRHALNKQSKTPRWKDGFIPSVCNWLENNRWLDDPKDMKEFVYIDPKKPKYKEYDGVRYYLHSNGYYYTKGGSIWVD
jgi:hypothetical protein